MTTPPFEVTIKYLEEIGRNIIDKNINIFNKEGCW